jgi:hypothetical protein
MSGDPFFGFMRNCDQSFKVIETEWGRCAIWPAVYEFQIIKTLVWMGRGSEYW